MACTGPTGRTLIVTLTIALAVLAGSNSARAATLMVGPGETYATVEAGLAAASAGDVVLVRAGTYEVSRLRPPSGVSLVSEDGPTATRLFASRGGQAILLMGVDDVRVEGFDIYAATDVGDRTNALVYLEAATNITIQNCFVHDAPRDGDVIKLNNTQDLVIEDTIIWNPAERTRAPGTYQECIDMRGTGDARITLRGSWLFHVGTQGDYLVYAKGGTTDLLWENNIFGPSAGSGSANVPVEAGHLVRTDPTPYESERFVIRNNLFVGLRGTGAFAFAGPRVALLYNNVFFRNQDINRALIELSANPADAGGPGIDLFSLNNIFSDNGDRPIYRVRDAATGANLTRDYNLYETTASGGDLDLASESGSVSSDAPLFIAPAVPVFDASAGTDQVRQALLGFRTRDGAPTQGAGVDVFARAGGVHPNAIPRMSRRQDAFGADRTATWDIGLFQACGAGCVCEGTSTECGGACVDTQTDASHCGSCGLACGASERCVAGECVARATDAGAPRADAGASGGSDGSVGMSTDAGTSGSDAGTVSVDDAGCACRLGRPTGARSPALWLPALVALVVWRRRRPRRVRASWRRAQGQLARERPPGPPRRRRASA